MPGDRHALGQTAGDALALLLFGAVGIFVSSLTRALQQARARAERTADALRLAREEAERANHAKDEFLAVVAHELKQPLSAMLPAVSLMRLRLSPESLSSSERTLDLLNRQIAHLQRMVTDLLDASRVVRGQVTLQPRLVDAFQVMRDAVAYTPPGGEIRVSADGDAACVVFRVRDSGEDIAAEDLARIFGLFTRAGGRREGGFGIGLAVARSLVELQGGTIHAYSEGPGRGSEFRLPVCDVPRAMAHSA